MIRSQKLLFDVWPFRNYREVILIKRSIHSTPQTRLNKQAYLQTLQSVSIWLLLLSNPFKALTNNKIHLWWSTFINHKILFTLHLESICKHMRVYIHQCSRRVHFHSRKNLSLTKSLWSKDFQTLSLQLHDGQIKTKICLMMYLRLQVTTQLLLGSNIERHNMDTECTTLIITTQTQGIIITREIVIEDTCVVRLQWRNTNKCPGLMITIHRIGHIWNMSCSLSTPFS